jgi:hypothetical protein
MDFAKFETPKRKELPRWADTLEMFNDFDFLAGGKAGRNGGSTFAESSSDALSNHNCTPLREPTFSKVFRWQLPDPQASPADSVEIVGSFTDWRASALTRDAITNTWQLTRHGIPGNRTHRYMLLVNGEPAQDKNADGLAVPEGFDEQQFQLMTPRGPRVFLLFAQTK